MDYWHKDWKCPFYKYNEQRKVCCEGGCRVQFADKSSAGQYMTRYCAAFLCAQDNEVNPYTFCKAIHFAAIIDG